MGKLEKLIIDMAKAEHILTLMTIGIWLEKQKHYDSMFGSREAFVAVYDNQIKALLRGEMPEENKINV